MSHHCHTCGKLHHDDAEAQLTHSFMKVVLGALSAILHKLDRILDRLPEPIGKPANMNLEFGQPTDTPKENQ